MNLSPQDLHDITQILGREPSITEQYIFDAMWSEHCSYKSSKDVLKKHLPTKGSNVRLGIGEDAGIIDFVEHDGTQYCIALAHESHNHPSQVLPIEGAATGVGGVVRDVYCMGADVIGVLDSLHFGVPTDSTSPIVEEIAEEVVLGVSDYGNALGVPVLGGETIYHPSYNDNCLVNVAAVGIVQADKIIRSKVPAAAANTVHDIILVGKSTDATGFGGASFSSVTLDSENDTQNIGAVQVHDPFLKRVLVEATKEMLRYVHDNAITIGFKDLGAGGIACAVSELAAAGGFGAKLDLNAINTAIDSLNPEVIACSETQERYAIIVPQKYSQDIITIYNNVFDMPKIYHQAGASIIGQITKETEFVMTHNNTEVCRLPVAAITTEVKATRTSSARTIDRDNGNEPSTSAEQVKDAALQMLSSLNSSSKRYVYRFYDNAVRGDTVVYPGEADAVVTTPVNGSTAGFAVSMDSNVYGKHDPYACGANAVAEAVRNIVAVGAEPLAITDCLNYGNPEKPDVFYDFEEGIKGIADACHALSWIDGESLPIVSGNVSFYNESKQGSAVVPSPVILAAGRLDDYKKARTMQLQSPQSELIRIGQPKAQFGGTQIQTLLTELNVIAPQPDLATESQQNRCVHRWIQSGKVRSAHDISAGGTWITICEMVLGERGLSKAGAHIQVPETENLTTALFAENGGYILEVDPTHTETLIAEAQSANVPITKIGFTTPDTLLTISQGDTETLSVPATQLEKSWNIKN